ncbi:adenylate/guanylate cyclase domain-containing protein [Paenibacillus sp. GP183]|uniref:adenylate/guanylate cyclase domain-containing protein n=1 Tax=Paenibacillus sp. GP183 TaxID=1882751 RepID=UPI00089680E3|nr:adenylate/guanylate cyclase domain-containing protein [Paenibacillus sp. GP183]SEB52725.1 Adenylate cyclase, class 3 [Paenibacillus sp. GP183]
MMHEYKSNYPDARVVIIDDQKTITMLLSKFLKNAGYSFITSVNEPLQAFKVCQEVIPDVIFLDINMPFLSGFDLLELFQNDTQLAQIPVIVLTSDQEQETKYKALTHGAIDFLPKPFEEPEFLVRLNNALEIYYKRKELENKLNELQLAMNEINSLNNLLQVRNDFIKEAFGRYVSDEFVNELFENPDSLALGGEKRWLTVMMTDIRGFSSFSEELAPEDVVSMINHYLEKMIDLIMKHKGTVIEILGDGMLVLFGAPIKIEDHAAKAVACAIEMQQSMDEINMWNRQMDLPELEMGIGIHTGYVVVGNIGSMKRTKYCVVGRNVNLTARIESFTTGGQILISEATKEQVNESIDIAKEMEIHPKGEKNQMTVYDVAGIREPYFLSINKEIELLIQLPEEISVEISLLEEKKYTGTLFHGSITKLSRKSATIFIDKDLPVMSNLKMSLFHEDFFHGKVVELVQGMTGYYVVKFTWLPLKVREYFMKSIGHDH